MPDDLSVAARLRDALPMSYSSPSGAIDPGVPGAVLRALVAMARISTRRQAEVSIALRRAGLSLSLDLQSAALRHLTEVGSVSDVIELDDGGVLLCVTSAGMERAYR